MPRMRDSNYCATAGQFSYYSSQLLIFTFFFSPGRLPIHRVHDLRLPHAGQTVFHPGPNERRGPALSSVTTWRL